MKSLLGQLEPQCKGLNPELSFVPAAVCGSPGQVSPVSSALPERLGSACKGFLDFVPQGAVSGSYVFKEFGSSHQNGDI